MSERSFSSWMTRIGNYFLTGFIVCAPLIITVYISWFLVTWVDSWVKPYVPERYSPDTYLPFSLPGLGLVFAFFAFTFAGFLTANLIGKRIVSFGESLLNRMPLVRGLYKTLKHIFQTVLSSKGEIFRATGLIEYPRPGLWSLVFVTGEGKTGIEHAFDYSEDSFVSVFLPCAPNPTAGFLVYVRKSEIKFLDISLDDALRLIVSAGLLVPENLSRNS